MKTILKTIAAASVAAVLSQAALAQEINFGIISTESQQNLRPKWEPLLADMEKATGLKVKPFFASDYGGVIEGMRFGKVQLAWYGNKSAMEAVDRAEGEVFVQTVASNGAPGYWSLVLVPKDSPINSLDDLLKCDKTLNFGLGDPNSTSGYLVPMTFVFGARGIDPKTCFKNVTNANHETNAMAVANGQVHAAANNTESLELIEKNQPAAFAKIKVIWKSPLIPSDPLVWRK
nr:phosphonate ABC transporter substrate-binding protein [Bosea sp. (in: a-proteobacteria)]